MDIDLVRNLFTITAFVAFLGILGWAYAPSRRGRFEADARIPFEADTELCAQPGTGKEGSAS